MRWSCIAVVTTVACGRIGFEPIGDGGQEASCAAFGPWTNLHRLAGATTDHETGPWLSPDGLDLWFARTVMGDTSSTLYHASRASTAVAFDLSVAAPAPFLPDPGTPDQQTTVFLTDDQLQIYYNHFQGTSNVYEASRASTSDPFANVTSLALNNDGVIHNGDPALTADALTLFYDQWQTGQNNDTVLVTARSNTAADFPAGTPLAGLAGNINGLSSDRDGAQLFYGLRPSSGPSQLVSATRVGDASYSAPAMVAGQPTANDNMHPQLSRDQRTLMFAGDASDGSGYDLYELDRSCVSP